MALSLEIPADLQFADLRIALDESTGLITLDKGVLERLCKANGVQIADIDGRDLVGLLDAWYAGHRVLGGAPDAAFERVLALTQPHAGGQPDKLADGRLVRHLH